MTEDERAVVALRFIAAHVKEYGYPPTRQQIAVEVGLASAGSVQPMMQRMIDQGLVRTKRYEPRAITITEAGMKAMTEELT
jgi:SOS-response transcriptional repressor LexA